MKGNNNIMALLKLEFFLILYIILKLSNVEATKPKSLYTTISSQNIKKEPESEYDTFIYDRNHKTKSNYLIIPMMMNRLYSIIEKRQNMLMELLK